MKLPRLGVRSRLLVTSSGPSQSHWPSPSSPSRCFSASASPPARPLSRRPRQRQRSPRSRSADGTLVAPRGPGRRHARQPGLGVRRRPSARGAARVARGRRGCALARRRPGAFARHSRGDAPVCAPCRRRTASATAPSSPPYPSIRTRRPVARRSSVADRARRAGARRGRRAVVVDARPRAAARSPG